MLWLPDGLKTLRPARLWGPNGGMALCPTVFTGATIIQANRFIRM
jgi:hypothetical protein